MPLQEATCMAQEVRGAQLDALLLWVTQLLQHGDGDEEEGSNLSQRHPALSGSDHLSLTAGCLGGGHGRLQKAPSGPSGALQGRVAPQLIICGRHSFARHAVMQDAPGWRTAP